MTTTRNSKKSSPEICANPKQKSTARAKERGNKQGCLRIRAEFLILPKLCKFRLKTGN